MKFREEGFVGLVSGLSNGEYHSLKSVSSSILKSMQVSAEYCYAMHYAKGRPERIETAGQRTGTLLHTIVLEPNALKERYSIGPEEARNTKAWKSFAENALVGTTLLKPSELQEGMAQAESLMKQSALVEAMAKGEAEVSAMWVDSETGLNCRCRPDWVFDCGEAGVILVDLKTGPAAPNEFARQAAKMGYDIQAAMYSEGYAIASARNVLAFVFANVETTYPYLSSVCQLDEESMLSGKLKYYRLLQALKASQEANKWNGWEGVQTVRIPSYKLETGE